MLGTFTFFLFLLLASAWFSGTETAFTSLKETRLSREKKTKGIKLLKELLRDKSSVIAAILVGNNIVNTVLAVYAGAFFDKALVSSGALTPSLGPLVASAVTIVFLLVFGEVIPKHFAVTFTSMWMKAVAYPLWLVVQVLRPLTRIMGLFSRLLINLLPFKSEEGDSPTISELLAMAKYSESAGHIDDFERKLMGRATRFNDLEAKDVMIPRAQIVAVSEDISLPELYEEVGEHLLTRLPVYRDTVDNILGIFNIKELVTMSAGPKEFSVLKFCHEPIYVPGSVPIGVLSDKMRIRKSHMAVVVDEFGATSGIVTLEDIIERIFGLIYDEYDKEESSQEIEKISETEFMVKGLASLDELSVAIGVIFPEEINQRVDTLNGLITYLKGDFPAKRDEIEYRNLKMKVEKIEGMRADEVRIIKKA